MKKRRAIWLRVLLYALAAVFIGVSFSSSVAARLTGDALPMPFGFGVSVVLSDSMQPTLSAGDLIVVTRASDYQVGDIVVYQAGKSGTVHRIVEIDGDTVVTRGDANNADDQPIARSQIKGRVRFRIPRVGYLINLVKSPAGICVVVALALFLTERSLRADRRAASARTEALEAELRRLMEGEPPAEKPDGEAPAEPPDETQTPGQNPPNKNRP